MTYRVDRRIVNACIEYKNQDINEVAFKAIVDFLEMISEEYPDNHTESSPFMKKKGAHPDGNDRKNKK